MEIRAPKKVDISHLFDTEEKEEYTPWPRVKKEKKDPVISVPLTLEQTSTLKFALSVAIHSCELQKQNCTSLSDKYAFDKLIEKYHDAEDALNQARVDWIDQYMH